MIDFVSMVLRKWEKHTISFCTSTSACSTRSKLVISSSESSSIALNEKTNDKQVQQDIGPAMEIASTGLAIQSTIEYHSFLDGRN